MLMDNTTFDNDTDEYIPYYDRPETYIVPFVFATIFFIGVVGNGTLIFIFLRNRSMRNIPNTYIMSLAVGDFMVMTGTVPFISTIYTFESWPYGEFICKISELVRDTSVSVTVLSLTMMSFDRYRAIVLPIQKHTGPNAKTFTVVVTLCIWLASLIIATPGAYFSFIYRVNVSNDKMIEVCYPFPQDMWPWYPRLVVSLKFLLLYAIPLITIGSFYILMAKYLLKASQSELGKNDTHRKQMRARAKVAKIVLVFVAIFAISFFPSHLFLLWFYFHPDPENYYNQFWHIWKIVGYVLSFASSCLNPLALYTISGVYRNYFRRYLFRVCYRDLVKGGSSSPRTFTGRSYSVRSSTRLTYSATRI